MVTLMDRTLRPLEVLTKRRDCTAATMSNRGSYSAASNIIKSLS